MHSWRSKKQTQFWEYCYHPVQNFCLPVVIWSLCNIYIGSRHWTISLARWFQSTPSKLGWPMLKYLISTQPIKSFWVLHVSQVLITPFRRACHHTSSEQKSPMAERMSRCGKALRLSPVHIRDLNIMTYAVKFPRKCEALANSSDTKERHTLDSEGLESK
jgi:hypothetical protein